MRNGSAAVPLRSGASFFFGAAISPSRDRLLAGKLAGAARRLGLFSCRLLRWLLIEAPPLHFAEHAFPLHFLLQDAKSLIDVVIADEDMHSRVCSGASSDAIGRDLDARAPGAHAPMSPGRMSVLR